MPINPQITPISPDGKRADAIAELRRRVAVLERGSSGGGSTTTTVADATTVVKGKLQLSGDLAGTAALPKVKNKLDVFNVKDAAYGATGDGTTNDTTAVQAAINAANSAGGGIVYFPKGTYLCSSLTGYSNVTFMGTGEGSIIRQKTPATDVDNEYLISVNGATATVAANASGIRVLDLQLQAANTSLSGAITSVVPATAGALTVASTAAFPTVGTLYIDGEQISYTGMTATTFTGITRGANGTTAASHVDASYTELVFGAGTQHVHLLRLSAVTDVHVSNVLFRGFRGDAIYLQGNDGGERHNVNVSITDCTFNGVNHQNRNAISIIDCDDLAIDRCTFKNTTHSTMPGAIDFEPNPASTFAILRGCRVTNCYFEEIAGITGAIALYLWGTAYTTEPRDFRFVGNTIRSSDTFAFLFSRQVTATAATPRHEILVKDNNVDNVARSFEIDGIHGVRFEGNNFKDVRYSGAIGYAYKCRDVLVDQCDFYQCGESEGYVFTEYQGDWVRIDRNTFHNCGAPPSDPDYPYGVIFRFESRVAPVTVAAGTDLVTLTAHGFVADQQIVFSFAAGGGMPSPLVQGTVYYARDITANTFKVAATAGGAAIDITTNGTSVVVSHPVAGTSDNTHFVRNVITNGTDGALPGRTTQITDKSTAHIPTITANDYHDNTIGFTPSSSNYAGLTDGIGPGGVPDATTVVKGKLQLAGDIAGTAAAPVVKKLTSLGTTAMTDQLLSDTAHGDLAQYFGLGLAGQRYNIYHGSAAAPVTTEGATLRISRFENFTTDVVQGAESDKYSCIRVMNIGGAGTKAQTVGVSGQARSSSTVTEVYPSRNPDALGFHGAGIIEGSGVGRGLGGTFSGASFSASSQRMTGVEAVLRNNSGVDATYSASTPPDAMSLHVQHLGTNKVSAGIFINNNGGFAAKYLVGIAIPTYGSIQDSTLRDDGTATTSLDIRGTHTYALVTGSTAGNVGIGTLTPTAARLQLATAALTDRVVDDTAHGGLAGGEAGQRWNIYHGSSGVGRVTTDGPTMHISRVSDYSAATVVNGANYDKYGALYVNHTARNHSRAQPIAGVFFADNDSDQTFNSLTANTDAMGIQAVGQISGSGTGCALGGSFGSRIVATSADVTGVACEFAMRNNHSDTRLQTVNTAGNASPTRGIWINNIGTYRAGAAIQLGKQTQPWHIGFYVGPDATGTGQGNCVLESTYRDYGNATQSIEIGGTHTGGAITIDAGAGYVGIGTPSPGFPLHVKEANAGFTAYFDNAATATSAAAINCVAGQQANLTFRDGGTSKWLVGKGTSGNSNHFFIYDAAATVNALTIATGGGFALGGSTSGGTYLQIPEQSATPTAPANTAARVFARDTAGTTELCYVVNGGAVTVLGAAGAGGYISSVANTTNIEHTVAANQLTSIIPTTATVQVTGLGVGAAVTAGFGVGITGAAQGATAGLFVNASGGTTIIRASNTNYLQFYSTSATNVGLRFRILANATDKNIRLGFSDGGTGDDGGGAGDGTITELHKVLGAGKLRVIQSTGAVAALEVTGALTVGTTATFGNVLSASSGPLLVSSGGLTVQGGNTNIVGNLSITATGGTGNLVLAEQTSTVSATAGVGKVYTDVSTVERLKVRMPTNDRVLMRDVAMTSFTQTYTTADATLSAYTADVESSAYTGVDNLQGGTPYAQVADLNALRVAVENLRLFTEDTAAYANAIVDALQADGQVG